MDAGMEAGLSGHPSQATWLMTTYQQKLSAGFWGMGQNTPSAIMPGSTSRACGFVLSQSLPLAATLQNFFLGRMVVPVFKSIFADEMEAYLALKTFSVSDPVVSLTKRALSSLDQYLAEIDFPQKELTEDILTPWISSIPGKSKTINEKVGAVRGFVKYLDSLGIPAFLPESPKVKSEYIPYIYSEAEIQKIMHYADNLSPRKPGSCSPFLQLKIPMALRILYGCGTRLGETMALQRKDVCFKEGTLFLRKTKFSKERLIPIHDSLLEILKRYCLTLGIMDLSLIHI